MSVVLTERQLNRALLARQGLLVPFADPLPRVLERVGGIQAQYTPSMYIGLWSRMASFERAELTDALEAGTAVQGTLLRGTIHLVSSEDYWPFFVGVDDSVRTMYQRNVKSLPDHDLAKHIKAVQSALADGPLRQKEIEEIVGRHLRGWVTAHLPLLRVPPSGTWERRRADLYADAEQWIDKIDITLSEARELLVRRYLDGFGPATPAEIASWAMMRVGQITPVLERLDLVRHEAEDRTELVDLPGSALPDAETPAPVRFLPTWDATLLVHKRRTQILPEEHRPKIFSSKTPHSFPTFLVDGRVAGTWRYEKGDVQLNPFEPLTPRTRREVQDAAQALTDLHR